MATKPKRLEAAEFDRAEAAVLWEDAANRADETGRLSDKLEADGRDRRLDDADQKIKRIESEPGTSGGRSARKGRRT
ncbi:MAG: hypothetical protein L3K07_00225 [Thermoplasmata archaeon]|nr:hypothetical protein [Thermoplasmata archaeon]